MSGKQLSDIEAFIRALPDPEGARTFLTRLESLHPARASVFKRNPILLSRLLTLAAYSPFLSETMLSFPEYIDWLKRETERDFDRVKSTEQLSDELGRFV